MPFNRKTVGIIAGVLVFVILAGYFLAYRPYTQIRAKGEVVMATAKKMKADIKENDIDLLKKDMTQMEKDYTAFEKEARSVYWASFVPYVADFKNGVEAGRYMVSAGQKSIDSIYPYADLIGFKKGEASFAEKSAEERLQTAVLTLDKVVVNVDAISEDIDKAQQKIEKIDPNRYPEKVGKTPVREQVTQIKDTFDGAASLFVNAKPLIKQLPKILGKEGERKYLILFMNEHERRATGGFLTAYAYFSIKDGKVEIQNSTNIYDLDDSISKRPALPEKIKQYHVNVNQFYIRDSNLSPDFVESIKLFESLYNNSNQKQDYDGIITMDTKVLVDLLKVYGDTEAGGITFSAREDSRCDCPQAIYEIFDNVGRPVGYIRENRKGILGDLMQSLFFKVVGLSPAQYWGPLFEAMFKDADEKHILANFKDKEIQSAIEQLNYGGRIKDVKYDYLHISNVNFAGAKSNLFVTEEIESETSFKDGKVQRDVKITFKNPYPHSDCNLERSSLCLNATLRNWIRFYVPEGSELVDFKGSETKVLTYEELNKTVFEGFMKVNPEGKAEVNISYTLPSSITEKDYKLLIQKQPGVSEQELKVDIDGKVKYDGLFDTDKEF